MLLAAGCGGAGRDDGAVPAGAEYVVERSRDGDSEHVRPVSGSRWGNARLVEELSIGEEVGADPYLFGDITGAWMTDEAIYVLDAQVPTVRAYDGAGRYKFDIGAPGQGPGEYLLPAGLAVTDNGRVLVADAMNGRVNVYAGSGELLDDWPLASSKSGLDLVVALDGRVFAQMWSVADEQMGMRAITADGPVGAPLLPPRMAFRPPTLTVTMGKGGTQELVLPFAPSYVWTMAPDGRMVVGVGSEYRFEAHAADGGRLVVERDWEPVPVAPGEARFRAALLAQALGPEVVIDAAELPASKPAFAAFYADRSRRLWVIREGDGRVDAHCFDADARAGAEVWVGGQAGTTLSVGAKPTAPQAALPECWTSSFVFDLYDLATGDLLAGLAAPEPGFTAPLFAAGDSVLAAVTDELGTRRVKRYRIVTDGGPGADR